MGSGSRVVYSVGIDSRVIYSGSRVVWSGSRVVGSDRRIVGIGSE